MADVKWIKVVTDIFDDEKVLLIETLPEADSIIVIWFKLLCLAGKQNNSGVFMMNERIPYTDKMLSTIFRRNENTVKLALNTFEEFGMIEIIDNVITIPNWEKHQKLDQLELAREKTRERVAKHREKQKLLALSNECNVTDGVTVTECNADRIDKNRIDKNRIDNNNIDDECESNNEVVKNIIEYLNNRVGTKYKTSTKDTQKHIKARLNEGYTYDDFVTVIDKQANKWIGTEYEQYLRPATLFGTKFENYLNAPNTVYKQPDDNKAASGNPFFDLLKKEGKM